MKLLYKRLFVYILILSMILNSSGMMVFAEEMEDAISQNGSKDETAVSENSFSILDNFVISDNSLSENADNEDLSINYSEEGVSFGTETFKPTIVATGNTSSFIDNNGDLYAWGDGLEGIGDGTSSNKVRPVKILPDITDACLDLQSGAIDKDGNLWMWGPLARIYFDQITDSNYLSPVQVMENIRHFNSNLYIAGIIDNDYNLLMWGENENGEVGNGTKSIQKSPVKVLSNVDRFYQLSRYSSAIDKSGNLWMWGTGASWLMTGNDYSYEYLEPVKILENIKQVSLEYNCAGAVDNDGNLWMWGDNSSGQLGDGTTVDKHTPFKLMSNIKQIDIRGESCGAIDNDGNLWMWGDNSSGQLGNGTTVDEHSPVKVKGNVKQFCSGGYSCGAIDNDGNLWMWGSNLKGQAGTGTSERNIYTPQKVLSNISQVHLTGDTSYAVDNDGNLYIWGENSWGQVGDGTKINRNKPYKVNLNSQSTVSFNSMGGSYVESQTIEIGRTVSKPANPEKPGYIFAGWYKDEKCSQEWDFSKDVVAAQLTILYAKWQKREELDFSKDIWSFHNYTSAPMIVDSSHLYKLLDSVDGKIDDVLNPAYNSYRESIYTELEENKTGGHCYGMSTSVISNIMKYQDIASNLFNVERKEGIPIINIYHLEQFLPQNENRRIAFMKKPRVTALQEVIAASESLDITGPALLSYGKDGWGGHTVVIYKLESNGSYTSPATGISYNKRINTYDCDAFNDAIGKYDDADHWYDIYIDTNTGSWEIPAYYEDAVFGSQTGALFYCLTTDREYINPINFCDSRLNDYMVDETKEAENILGVKGSSPIAFSCDGFEAIISQNGILSSSEEMISYYDSGKIKGQPLTSPIKVVLPQNQNGKATIRPSSLESEKMDISLSTRNYYIKLQTEKADSITIDQQGSLDVNGNNGNISLCFASNLVPLGQYNTFKISGATTGKIGLLLKDNGGVRVSSDSLSGLTLIESDGLSEKEVIVDPSKNEVEMGGEDDKPIHPINPINPDNPEDPEEGVEKGDLPEGKSAPEGIWVGGLKKSYPYTGSAIKPPVRVYKGNTRLIANTDYSLSYKKNKNVGTSAMITVKMKGAYKGSKNLTFAIEKNPLTSVSFNKDNLTVAYKKNKKHNNIKPALIMDGKTLKYSDKDFEFKYFDAKTGQESSCIEVGDYIIRIVAKSTSKGYTGSLDVPFEVSDKPTMGEVKIMGPKKGVVYNGKKQIPTFTLKYKDQPVSSSAYTMLTVSEDTYTEPGSHYVVFKGNGTDFIGSRKVTYKITGKRSLADSNATAILSPSSIDDEGKVPFSYGGAKPKLIISYNGIRLKENRDYTLLYRNNKKAGNSATVTAKGKGIYKGSKPIIFTVSQRDLGTLLLTVNDRAVSNKANDYKKTPILFTDKNYVDQKLKANTDYTATFTVSSGSTRPVPGDSVIVKIETKTDGNYKGTATASYKIIEKSKDISKAKVVINGGKAYAYTGSAIKPTGSEIQVTLNNKPVSTSDYEISAYYNNVNCSKSAVVVIKGRGNLSGSKAVKFTISRSPVDKIWDGPIILRLLHYIT